MRIQGVFRAIFGIIGALGLLFQTLAQTPVSPTPQGVDIPQTAPAYVTIGRYDSNTLGRLAQPALAQPAPNSEFGIPGSWPTYTEQLVPGAGVELVESHCSICHSVTYIPMQPPLSEAKWEETVQKMLNTFGAKQFIPESAIQPILAYLKTHYAPRGQGSQGKEGIAPEAPSRPSG